MISSDKQMRHAFKSVFGVAPAIYVEAPGRVNIIGEHVDHQHYPVFPCAINHKISCVGGLATEGPVLTVHHTDNAFPPLIVNSWKDATIDREARHWFNYVLSGLFGLVEFRITHDSNMCGKTIDHALGFNTPVVSDTLLASMPRMNLVFAGDVPVAAGVSSSSSLIVASTTAMWGLWSLFDKPLEDVNIPKELIARICTEAERHVGVCSGGMDQASICLSKQGKALKIDFAPLTYEAQELPQGCSLVVMNTCRVSAKAASAPFHYNKRVFELAVAAYVLAKQGAAKLGVPLPENFDEPSFQLKLKDVQLLLKLSKQEMVELCKELLSTKPWSQADVDSSFPQGKKEELLSRVGEDVWEKNDTFSVCNRAIHVFEEASRVDETAALCASISIENSDKAVALGKLMDASHFSLKSQFECSCEELDAATDLARSLDGCYGSRLTGAGWGGCCVSLVESSKVAAFMDIMMRGYLVETLKKEDAVLASGQTPVTKIPRDFKDMDSVSLESFGNVLFEVSPADGVSMKFRRVAPQDDDETVYDATKNLLSVNDRLSALFQPKTVGVIGATQRPGAVGYTVMRNLLSANEQGGYQITVYPINATRTSVCGIQTYKSVVEVPARLDLVFVITPAKVLPSITEACGRAGVKTMVIITAGFKEVGAEGKALEDAVISSAKKFNIRVVGPNCLGVMAPIHGLNGTFAATNALPGSLAFISQSGAMCTAALDWSMHERVGFSAFVSLGNMADVNWGDMITYLGKDANTKAILMYMETIGDVRSFLSAAKTVSQHKPIIVLKAGKSDEAAAAAASHTGSLAGSHDAFLAAMKRAGVLCVDRIEELFNCALLLDKQPRPEGPRLMIITNAGGPGVLATDATVGAGGELSVLEPEIVQELDSFLPSAWSRANPVDVLGDADAAAYKRSLEVAMKSKSCDGVLVVLSPQSVTEPMATAESLVAAVEKMKLEGTHDKPILASWMGGLSVLEGFQYLNRHGVPAFSQPDAAAKTFCQVWSQTRSWQTVNSEVDIALKPLTTGDDGAHAKVILREAYEQGREILSEQESKEVLKSYGVPIADTIVCETAEAAAAAGELVRFPCVLKLHSKTITHKSDVGGVLLNVKDAQGCLEGFDTIKANCAKHASAEDFEGVTVQPMLDLAAGIELLLGAVTDNQFGPMVVFGFGGCMVEIFKDTSSAIPPLNSTTALLLVEATKISKALKGVGNARFPGCDMNEIVTALVAFSKMVVDCFDLVSELEINPLLALSDRVVALDARIVMRRKDDPCPALAVLPYPSQFVRSLRLGDVQVDVRPVGAADLDRMREFVLQLAEDGITLLPGRVSDDLLASFVNADYASQVSLLCLENENVIGCLRMTRMTRKAVNAYYAVLPAHRNRGVGSVLHRVGLEVAHHYGYQTGESVVKSNDAYLKNKLQTLGWSSVRVLHADVELWRAQL
ncbi:MAG: uncharacterized protein KVP18_002568 [Porospora cf. gigantea A]|uniref:uncharacterized protein n=1 Tax=Porospora cf. gigantea A TaxID=2853593 RepID=UPI00355A7B93|nr:MAG: hypothetical protein KVP18_002568 [Porospora cf. gigantea A]